MRPISSLALTCCGTQGVFVGRLSLSTQHQQAYVARHFGSGGGSAARRDSVGLAIYFNLDNGVGAIRGPMVDQFLQYSTESDSTFRVW